MLTAGKIHSPFFLFFFFLLPVRGQFSLMRLKRQQTNRKRKNNTYKKMTLALIPYRLREPTVIDTRIL